MSSEEWWAEVVRTSFRGAGVTEENLEGPVFDDVFHKLFHDVFTDEPAWELVPVSCFARDGWSKRNKTENRKRRDGRKTEAVPAIAAISFACAHPQTS